MNANELADELDVFAVELTCKISEEAATMLRQQQAEIEAMKAQLAKYPQQGQSIPCKFTEGM